MRHRHAVLFFITCLALPLSTTLARAAGDAAKGEATAQVCAACHGPGGNSMIAINPRLAGQHEGYIVAQLQAFKSGARKNPLMTPMAANLSEDDMRNLGAYYASQTPPAGAARDAASVEVGRKLFRGGNAANSIAACAGCHSPNGAGVPAQYPRLAGQHADYTAAQLKAFRSGERNNDLNGMMRAVAARLSNAEIDSLAQYVAGLK